MSERIFDVPEGLYVWAAALTLVAVAGAAAALFVCTKRSRAKRTLEALRATLLNGLGSSSSGSSSGRKASADEEEDGEAVAPHISECVLRLLVPETEMHRSMRTGTARRPPTADAAAPFAPPPLPQQEQEGNARPQHKEEGGDGEHAEEQKEPPAESKEEEPAAAAAAAEGAQEEQRPLKRSGPLEEDAARSWALLDTLCDCMRLDEAERFWAELLGALGVSRTGTSFAGARAVVHALTRATGRAAVEEELMRTNDANTKAYRALTRVAGRPYLDSVLHDSFRALLEPADKYFTCTDMLAIVSDLLGRLAASADALDPALVAAVGAVHHTVAVRFPSADNTTARNTAATLLFLRYLSPAIACPAAIQDSAADAEETDDDRRVLQLLLALARMFQAVINCALAPPEELARVAATGTALPVLAPGVCGCECGSEEAHSAAVAAVAREHAASVRMLVDRVIARHEQLDWDLAEQQSLVAQHTIALGSEQQEQGAAERERQRAAARVVRFVVRKYSSIENTLSLRDPHVAVQLQELVSKVTGQK